MKKKAIKIAASTAVAASAFVAAAPVQQADAATNVNQLATNAQNAGTVLKWAISYEGSADFKTRPFNEFNAAKKAVAAAEAAANKLSATEKLAVQAKLVDAKVQIVRATAYIDAITSSEKIKSLTSNLTAATASGDLGKVETAYHAASFEYKKQAKLLDRVYGQSTRDGIRNAVKPAMESALDAVKYDVTVKMHLDKASALIKESKLEEAAAELAKADYNLTLKDAKFTFKSQLEKSYADVAASLPLQAISAIGDGANTVTVKFSKAYTLDKNLTTLEAGQFKINGLTVQSAKLSEDKKSVILTTSTQKANTEYTVTWQGKSVSFKTAAVADTSGIAVNETDAEYKETTENRKYTAKLTNTDGTPYVGRVTVKLGEVNAATTTTDTTAVITSVNGTSYGTTGQTWTGVTDSQGNLVFTIAAAYGATKDTASVTHVRPTITKLDGDEKTNEKLAGITHFFQLQTANVSRTLNVTSLRVDVANDYVYANGFKYKWDANDEFFVNSQKVSQETFESRISNGDTVTVDYNATAANSSVWNITVDVTKSEDLEIGNADTVTYDGYNYDLSGKGQAGNTVKVYRLNNLVGTAVVDSSGNWTLRAVNLEQNASNVFTAYQYLPGKDGVNGSGSENQLDPAIITINEGAFASTGIKLNDKGDNGLSVTDTLDFTFLNNDKSYGHKFNDSVKAGTITVTDGQSKTAVLTVKKTAANQLEVTKISDATADFNFKSSTLTVTSTSGVINQDQLAYNVSASTGKTLNFGAGPVVPGSTVVVSSSAQLIAALADSKVANIVFDGGTYPSTYEVNRNVTIDLNGRNGASFNVNSGTLSLTASAAATVATVNAKGGNVSVGTGVTVGTLVVAANKNVALTNDGAVSAVTFNTGSSVTYYGYTAKTNAGLVAVQTLEESQATPATKSLAQVKSAVSSITSTDAALKTQLEAKVAQLEAPALAETAAVDAVRLAAVAGNQANLATALNSSYFTGYKSANNAAYVAEADFDTATTVAQVNAAIEKVNNAVVETAAVTAVKDAKVAGVKSSLATALSNSLFTGYNVANLDAYFAEADFSTVTTAATVNAAIAKVNSAEAAKASASADIDAAVAALATPALNGSGVLAAALPATVGSTGVAVAWTSGDTAVVSDAGVYAGAGTTTLTATITKAGGTTKTVVFNVTTDATKITAITK